MPAWDGQVNAHDHDRYVVITTPVVCICLTSPTFINAFPCCTHLIIHRYNVLNNRLEMCFHNSYSLLQFIPDQEIYLHFFFLSINKKIQISIIWTDVFFWIKIKFHFEPKNNPLSYLKKFRFAHIFFSIPDFQICAKREQIVLCFTFLLHLLWTLYYYLLPILL